MPERVSNLGYMALKKESTKGTAVTPDTYVPLYEESLVTDVHLDEDTPIVGHKYFHHQVLQGLRSHTGDIKVLAEPNTAARILDMHLTKGSTTGSGPYTHPFTLSNTTNPNSYTVDIAKGQVVFRFMGLEVSEIEPDFEDNKMVFNLTCSALKSFTVREVSSLSTDTLTLKTNYDPSPTTGLVVGDLVRLFKADGTTVDLTVESIDSATEVTFTSTPTGAAGGDYIALRPATPSLSVVTPFLWTRSEFRFAATAADALSATHTPLQEGSKWILTHEFEDDEGSKRSGSFDPASLVRKLGKASLTAIPFFDTPESYNRFLTVTKRACVIRHFSETGYELRVTLNNLKAMEDPVSLNTDEVIYEELEYVGTYDSSDGQAFDVKVINNVSSI